MVNSSGLLGEQWLSTGCCWLGARHSRLQQEHVCTLQSMYKQEEIPLVPGGRERLWDGLFIGSSFCFSDFHLIVSQSTLGQPFHGDSFTEGEFILLRSKSLSDRKK